METIDQALFNFSPKIGLAVAVMVGFLVFAVALDLTWNQFRRVLKNPKAPGIGLLSTRLVPLSYVAALAAAGHSRVLDCTKHVGFRSVSDAVRSDGECHEVAMSP